MFEVKGLQDEGAKADGSNGQDNSLAARMVRKLAAEEEKERKVESKPTYSGQILEDDEHGDEDGGSNWLSTKFRDLGNGRWRRGRLGNWTPWPTEEDYE